MTLLSGDLTTPNRVATWMASAPTLPSNIINQLITSMTALIYGKLNRARLYSQIFTRVFDGVGNMQLVLPDWPVTAVKTLQQGSQLIQPSALSSSPGYGYRFIPWSGNLPGDPSVIEFVGGYFYTKPQNVQVVYQAGYLIQNEIASVPTSVAYTITVQQPLGLWCRDNGVSYVNGAALVPVLSTPTQGQYIPPTDTAPGLYTFSSTDAGAALSISYSFIPADLEEACIQMIAERYSYRGRIGEISKSLGGQETIRFLRGSSGAPYGSTSALPPEVMDLINPYISVIYPAIGAPL